MRSVQGLILSFVSMLSALGPVAAQGYREGPDQNLGHFYMSRREIQILDDGPNVSDMRTQPSAPGAAGRPPVAINGAAALPRAGWQQYSTSIPSMKSSLPMTVNGVPPKALPAAGINAKMAKAGAYKGKKGATAPAAATAKSTWPMVAKSYAPYKGYGPSVGVPTQSASRTNDTSTKVQGSLLNRPQSGNMLRWNRTRTGN